MTFSVEVLASVSPSTALQCLKPDMEPRLGRGDAPSCALLSSSCHGYRSTATVDKERSNSIPSQQQRKFTTGSYAAAARSTYKKKTAVLPPKQMPWDAPISCHLHPLGQHSQVGRREKQHRWQQGPRDRRKREDPTWANLRHQMLAETRGLKDSVTGVRGGGGRGGGGGYLRTCPSKNRNRHLSAAVADARPPPAQPSSGGNFVQKALGNASTFLPQAVVGSTALAIAYPPSFNWFTTQYYAPALGFLMFSIGVNLGLDDFKTALESPSQLALGYFAQFVIKPALGVALAASVVPLMGLPDAVGSGLILVACVSGAQLSNYATFLVHRHMAPLSIAMTALSTASAALVTPALTLLLLGKRLPVNFNGMMLNIAQIVLIPISAGLLLNRFASPVSSALRPFLPSLSLLTTCLCVGSPIAINISAVRSVMGISIIVPVFLLHASAFVGGYWISQRTFPGNVPLARTISFETGMQSSLLALALANQFFPDPLVALPCAISTVLMSLMGFALVTVWRKDTSTS